MYPPGRTSLVRRLLAVLALLCAALRLPINRSAAPIAVMVDNFEATRPKSGLAAADVV